MKSAPFIVSLLLAAACTPAGDNTPARTTEAALAAFAIPDNHAADVTRDVLQSGGNAVDAAVAAGFMLAVTLPEAGNVGGGGFMLIHMNGESSFLDYRETAPAAAHRDMYLDEDGEVIEKKSSVGIASVGVPGTVAGLWAAHRRYGRMPWSELVSPAIEIAERGFIVPAQLVDNIDDEREWLAGTNFSEHFGSLEAGQLFRQPQLAAVLRRIADDGPAGFYAGKTAELLVDFMAANNGLISHEDLQNYQPVWREPLQDTWRGYEVVSAPPPSSGGFAVIHLLKMKEYLSGEFDGLQHNSAQYIHLIAEMEKRVFADRAEYFGDPEFVEIPINRLMDPAYIAKRAKQVDAGKISTVAQVPPGLESPDTAHFSIIDAEGNAVANTYTLNWSFGSGMVVEGAGFLLNNEMDDFSAKPGIPNLYGVVGGDANAIEPGKRMLSSMSPTLLIRNGTVTTALGTRGGSTIISSVFQALVNLVEFGMSPVEAAAASRVHHQLSPPDHISYSRTRPLPDGIIFDLQNVGYDVQPHPWEFGDLQIIHHDGHKLAAGSDHRGRGVSAVFPVPPSHNSR